MAGSSKKKTLYLHIGTDKTGSTAFQRFCRDNAEGLAERGVVYLRAARGGSWNHHAAYDRTNEGEFGCWTDIADELHSSPQSLGLVSFEGFYHIKAEPLQTIAERLAGLEVKVLIYLRRQSDMVRSGVAQRIKQGGHHLPLSEYNAENLAAIGQDYGPILDRFARVFGADNLIVRRYEASRWPAGNLILDALDAVGLKLTCDEFEAAFKVLKYDPNPSLDVDAIHLFDTLDRLGVDATQRRLAVRYLLAQMPSQNTTFVPDRLANAVDESFAAVNRRLAQDWFGEDVLFTEPSRFVFREPDEKRIAAYFLTVRRFFRLREMRPWPGKPIKPQELLNSGRLSIESDSGSSEPVVVREGASVTLRFRTAAPEQKSLFLEMTGTWPGPPGRLEMAINGYGLYDGDMPTFTVEVGGWLRENRAQLLELQLKVAAKNDGPQPSYRLDSMSYRVA